MPTTEEARPGVVLPEYGPTAPALARRHLGPRGGRRLAVATLLVVGAVVALVAAGSGDGLDTLEHRSRPVFTLLHPPDQVRRVPPRAGELVRLEAARGPLRTAVTVRRLSLPAYDGSVSGLLPILAERHAAALARELPGFELRGEGKARVNDAPGYQLRYRAGPPERRTIGFDIFVVPEDGDREGVLLRHRQTNPARRLGEPGRELAKAARKAFRSFRFGLDRP